MHDRRMNTCIHDTLVWMRTRTCTDAVLYVSSHAELQLKTIMHKYARSLTHGCILITLFNSGFIIGSAWYADCKGYKRPCPWNTHTFTHLHTPICTCTNLYNIICVEHLSVPGAVVNKPSPWREVPANEVNCMLLHCVTQWGWPAAAWGSCSPGHCASLC